MREREYLDSDAHTDGDEDKERDEAASQEGSLDPELHVGWYELEGLERPRLLRDELSPRFGPEGILDAYTQSTW